MKLIEQLFITFSIDTIRLFDYLFPLPCVAFVIFVLIIRKRFICKHKVIANSSMNKEVCVSACVARSMRRQIIFHLMFS